MCFKSCIHCTGSRLSDCREKGAIINSDTKIIKYGTDIPHLVTPASEEAIFTIV